MRYARPSPRTAGLLAALLTSVATACAGAAPTAVPTPSVAAPPSPSAAAPTPTAGPSQPLTLLWQTAYTAEAALIGPSDVVVDQQGNSYVSTQDRLAIKMFDPDGKFLGQWGAAGSSDGQINLAAGLAIDAAGDLYVADFQNVRIEKFDTAGNFKQKWPTEPPVGPASVAVDAHGNAFVDNFDTHNHYLQKFDSSGQLLNQWASTGAGPGQIGAGQQGGPEDIALDAAGNVYVADALNYRIQKFDTDGKLLAIFGGKASKKGRGLFYDPRGIAVDQQGHIYVLDSFFLQKLDANGNFMAQWPTTGGDLDQAGIMALDEQANIYVFAHAEVTSFATGTKVSVFVLKKFRQPPV